MKILKPANQKQDDTALAIASIQKALVGKPLEIHSNGGKIVELRVQDSDEEAADAALKAAERDFPGAF